MSRTDGAILTVSAAEVRQLIDREHLGGEALVSAAVLVAGARIEAQLADIKDTLDSIGRYGIGESYAEDVEL